MNNNNGDGKFKRKNHFVCAFDVKVNFNVMYHVCWSILFSLYTWLKYHLQSIRRNRFRFNIKSVSGFGVCFVMKINNMMDTIIAYIKPYYNHRILWRRTKIIIIIILNENILSKICSNWQRIHDSRLWLCLHFISPFSCRLDVCFTFSFYFYCVGLLLSPNTEPLDKTSFPFLTSSRHNKIVN